MISVSNREYFKLYLWRFTSIISGFLSMIVVVPHISRDKELFGIYSIIMSLALYLTYADFGFLSAGQKYAAESYAKGDKISEYRTTGFTLYLLIIMSIPFMAGMFLLSYKPTLIISELSIVGRKISSQLFLLLAFLLPFQVFLQRLVQSILSIRLKDYVYLRIDLIANLVKILSVYWFFRSEYLIVEYVIFSIVITVLGQMIILYSLEIAHGLQLSSLLKEIRFSLDIYKKVKKLALSSLLITVSWVLYYELDLLYIGRLLGATHVAIYAVAFTFLNFTRTLWNAFYSPFAHRFNHLIVEDSKLLSNRLLKNLMQRTFPLTTLVTVNLILATDSIIYSWVGNDYTESIFILQILLLGSLTVSINKPVSYYCSAHVNYKFLHYNAIVTPGIFFMALFLVVPYFGLIGFAMAKTFAVFVSFLVGIFFIKSVYNPWNLVKYWYLEVLIILFLLYPLLRLFSYVNSRITDHDTYNLMFVLMFVALVIISMSAILLAISKKFRIVLCSIIRPDKF